MSIWLDGQKFSKGLPCIGFSSCSAIFSRQMTDTELSFLHLWKFQRDSAEPKQQTGCHGWRLVVIWKLIYIYIIAGDRFNWLCALTANLDFSSAVSHCRIHPRHSSKHYASTGDLLPRWSKSPFFSLICKYHWCIFDNVSSPDASDRSLSFRSYRLARQSQVSSASTAT